MSQKTKEARAAYWKKWYADNREKVLPKARRRVREWQKKNRRRRNKWCRGWTAKNPGRNAEANRRSREKLKSLVLEHYGAQCSCCGAKELDFLSVDHVKGGGSKQRKVSNGGGSIYRVIKNMKFPKSFQILCRNCNWSKHVGGGVCVHKR